MSCKHKDPGRLYRVGDRVWSTVEQQHGTITRCRLPAPCGPDCRYTPCARCGGDGIDALAPDGACEACDGYGTKTKPRVD